MNNDDNLERYLRTYYLRFYPHDLIIKWLSYSKADGTLANREFAFILRDDVHIRFLSFNNANEFSAKLMEKVPYKIDIGAVYNRPPRDRKQVGEFMPIQRELVFDIDLTDYDSIRNCCKDANVCSKCWRWITIAVTVLEKLLKDHFGFASLLWVFSGRRGIHCWVADHQARSLSNKAREAVAKYLIFDKKGTAINKHRVHPVVEDAYDIIAKSPEFEKLVLEQGWLNSREHWASILRLCSEEMAKKIDTAFENLSSAKLRFELLMSNKLGEKENWKDGADLSIISGESDRNFLRYFVMEYAYPRLDEKVTTGLNHLLKLPFTVHPKTGKIAVPLNAKLISNLDLEQLPQVDKLTTELMENSAKQKVYRRSSLAPYIEVFEDFIDGLNKHQ